IDGRIRIAQDVADVAAEVEDVLAAPVCFTQLLCEICELPRCCREKGHEPTPSVRQIKELAVQIIRTVTLVVKGDVQHDHEHDLVDSNVSFRRHETELEG